MTQFQMPWSQKLYSYLIRHYFMSVMTQLATHLALHCIKKQFISEEWFNREQTVEDIIQRETEAALKAKFSCFHTLSVFLLLYPPSIQMYTLVR